MSTLNRAIAIAAEAHTGSRDYNHAESPLRHIPLGGKIGLAALMLVAGLYYLAHAFRLLPT